MQSYRSPVNDEPPLEKALFFYALGNLYTFLGNSNEAEQAYSQSINLIDEAEQADSQGVESSLINRSLVEKAKRQSQLLALRPSINRLELFSGADQCLKYLELDDLIMTQMCLAQIHFLLGQYDSSVVNLDLTNRANHASV